MEQIKTLADLLAARPLQVTAREIKSLGGKTVHFRELSGDALELVIGFGKRVTAARSEEGGAVSFEFTKQEMAEVLSQSLCDSDGDLLAADPDGPARLLRELRWDVLNEIFSASLPCIGLNPESVEEKKTD